MNDFFTSESSTEILVMQYLLLRWIEHSDTYMW